ncbi:MAG: asparagine synthase (glutamine-hydrolyzing) [Oscillospiraceae bacterium]|nr:asparagine synthase (glutamine-hydrolyzing) [Oscillospiraceae bacterium]
MCAIAGIIGLPMDDSIVSNMLSTMRRRGPDAQGSYIDRDCCLLHSRLTVIDPEGGVQPMHLCWQGKEYTIVYNGELYNTEELRQELKILGHEFQSHSDTEVLLHAYAQWQNDVLDKLNGIFAFAIWEHGERKLFLARDRMGVKPLFFKLHDGGLLFASELKTILAYPTVRAELDETGVAEIILLGPGRTPGCGVFRGIEELEGGCSAKYYCGKLTINRYWRLTDRPHTDPFEETAQKVRYLVSDAIRRQMISDVPIGTFLSGGLDSSLITSLCASAMKEQGGRLKTFSVDYVNNDLYFTPEKFQPNSDGTYIRMMQNTLGTEHHWCVLSPEELLDSLEEAVAARDLPGMADVDISLLRFCRKIREHVTVALSGECADEIFGGYPWYRDPEIRDLNGFPWAQNTAQRCEMMVSPTRGKEYILDRYRKTCAESDILPGTPPLERRMKEMMNLNLRWFMQTLLDRKDRMSMYSGLEVRVPFCDHRIAEYLYGVPWEFKDYNGKEKGLLRYAMNGVLPNEVLWRQKSPYPKTHDPKYLKLVSQRLQDLLRQKDAPLFSLLRKDMVKGILEEEPMWPWYGQLMRRPQTIAYLLQINHWLERYAVDVQI